MPVYEFVCPKCQTEFEVMRPLSRLDEPALCPRCGQRGERLMSVFGSKVDYYMKAPARDAFRKKPLGDEKEPAS